MRMHGTMAGVALALLLPAAAAAQAPDFTWHGTLAAGKTLAIRNVNGRIDATPASGNTIEVTAVKHEGRRGDPDEVRVEAVEGADGVTICAVYPTPRRAREENRCGPGDDYQMSTQNNDTQVLFTVKVPAGVRLDASTVNGGVRVEGLRGDAEVHSVNGDVSVDASGVVAASTVNGSIEASMGRADWTGSLEFETVNGGITITAPASLSTEIDAETVNGSIDSDFPITVRGRMERRHLRGTIGQGGRRLELQTVNGGIRLRKTG